MKNRRGCKKNALSGGRYLHGLFSSTGIIRIRFNGRIHFLLWIPLSPTHELPTSLYVYIKRLLSLAVKSLLKEHL